jgi:hypothetical protein
VGKTMHLRTENRSYKTFEAFRDVSHVGEEQADSLLFNSSTSGQTFIINTSFLCFYPVISKKMLGQKEPKGKFV